MPEDTKLLWVRSTRNDDNGVLYEVDDQHPQGFAHVAGKTPSQVADTPLVVGALRQGTIEEVPAGEVEEWQKGLHERAIRNAAASSQLMTFNAELVNSLAAQVAELQQQMGKPSSPAAAQEMSELRADNERLRRELQDVRSAEGGERRGSRKSD